MLILLLIIVLLGLPYEGSGGILENKIFVNSPNLDFLDKGYSVQPYTQATQFFNDPPVSQTLFGPTNLIRNFVGAELHIRNPALLTHARYTYSVMEDYHYFRPYQLALKLPAPDGAWLVGRYRRKWDWADEFWNRGLWEPLYEEDALRAEPGGLTGLFRTFDYEDVQLTLFGSLLFLPGAGPYFTQKNGQLFSPNPWFVPPPKDKILFTNILPSYQILPWDWDQMLQLSLASQVQYKNLYFSYAYKPMNKIRTKGSLILDLSKEPKGTHKKGYSTPIPLKSVVLQHHLLSLGGTLDYDYISPEDSQKNIYRLTTSVTYQHPEIFEPKEKGIIFFQPRNEWHLSVKGELKIEDQYEDTTLHIAYTHQLEDTYNHPKTVLSDVFPEPDEQQFFRNDLFQFSRAVSAGIHHFLKLSDTENTDLQGRLIYHLMKQYFLFSFRGSVTFSNTISFFASGDILFTEFPFSLDQTMQDIKLYKNRSRIFGGVSFAF